MRVFEAAIKRFRDEFDAISWAGSDGNANWAADWQETGESQNPSAGRVRVENKAFCALGNCLRIGGDQVNINGRGAVREADLTSFGTATLHFSYVRRLTDDGNGGSVSVQVSPDGVAWTALQTYPLDASDGAPVPQSFDITPYMTATTQIRFQGSGSSVESYFYADDVWIEPEGCDSP